MNLYPLLKPLGIVTFIFLVLTIASGMLKWKLKIHKLLAFVTLALAAIHALIAIML